MEKNKKDKIRLKDVFDFSDPSTIALVVSIIAFGVVVFGFLKDLK